MKRLFAQVLSAPVVISFLACSSTPIEPLPPPPEVPEYTKVPHPMGYGLNELKAIFRTQHSPDLATLNECDKDYETLRQKTDIQDELIQGARELVQLSPLEYHWCFYSKMIDLQEGLKQEASLKERQKKILDRYLFLVPIAKAFQYEYNDSRYLRWAINHYAQLSEWYFYRRLEMSPNTIQELGSVTPGALSFVQAKEESKTLVLEKYGILKQRTPASITTLPPPVSSEFAPVVPSEIPTADPTQEELNSLFQEPAK